MFFKGVLWVLGSHAHQWRQDQLASYITAQRRLTTSCFHSLYTHGGEEISKLGGISIQHPSESRWLNPVTPTLPRRL